MGGCGSREQRKTSLAFEDEKLIRNLFHTLSRRSENSEQGNSSGVFGVPIVAKPLFVKHFSECKPLAKKLFEWMVQTCPEGHLDEETFVSCIEVLVLESANTSFLSTKYQKMDKTEILAWAFFELWKDPEHNSDVEISYMESWRFLKAVLELLTPEDFADSKSKHTFEMTIRVICDTVFAHAESTQMGVAKFISLLRSDFPHLNSLIRTYFISKCLTRAQLEHPEIEGEPMLLNLDIYMLLYITSNHLQSVRNMRRIYHGSRHVVSFSDLASALQHYDAPFIVLLKCLEKSHDIGARISSASGLGSTGEYIPRIKDEADSGVYSVIGGLFSPGQGKPASGAGRIGVFSLLPRLRMLNPKSGAPQTHIVLDGFGKKGLGLGGRTTEDCRLWIDADIAQGSYVDGCTEDSSYSNGHVVGPTRQKIAINEIEVWGLGSDEVWESKLRRSHLNEERAPSRLEYAPPAPVYSPPAPVVFEERNVSKSVVADYSAHRPNREKTSAAPPRPKRATETRNVNVSFDDDIERIVQKYQGGQAISTAKIEVTTTTTTTQAQH